MHYESETHQLKTNIKKDTTDVILRSSKNLRN